MTSIYGKYDTIKLRVPLKCHRHQLQPGDYGTIVDLWFSVCAGQQLYEVEFFNDDGSCIGFKTLTGEEFTLHKKYVDSRKPTLCECQNCVNRRAEEYVRNGCQYAVDINEYILPQPRENRFEQMINEAYIRLFGYTQ
jgi:hypothetical protein